MDETAARRLAVKASETTREATEALHRELEPSDYLLGWMNNPGVWRCCHSFDEDETDDLAGCVEPKAHLIRSFQADDRNGKLNTYPVFQRA